jgi:hypothetical protein
MGKKPKHKKAKRTEKVKIRGIPDGLSKNFYWGILILVVLFTAEGDKIAVLGSEPQIYFYSNRHSATGYIYVYGLLEDQKYVFKMQKEMAEEIEKANPKYLFFVNIPTSWLVNVRSERYIFNWFEEYRKKIHSCGLGGYFIKLPN